MFTHGCSLSFLVTLLVVRTAFAYDLVRDYSGVSFFDRWDFYGNYDNLTSGDVWYLDRDDAYSQGLAYVNSAGNVIMKVDDMHSIAFGQMRNSVRITSQDTYAVGSLWIVDVVHVPYGCSVWGAWWTKGPTWPDDGEIDIFETINLMTYDQYALHTTSGCTHHTSSNQLGTSEEVDCSQASGCTVIENKENSAYTGFVEAGGGVWAVQFDVAGIFIWFWSVRFSRSYTSTIWITKHLQRPDVPLSVTNSTSTSAITDLTQWGPPSASYLADTCNITEYFTPQNLIFDITLCGTWAGLEEVYYPSCGSAGPTGLCYNDMVVGSGLKFSEAYFEIKYLRAYTTGGVVPAPTVSASAVSDFINATHTTVTAFAGTGLSPTPLFFYGNEGLSLFNVELAGLLVSLGVCLGTIWIAI
ncbi:glycoside hydrolase family 16 protein [Fistulina hepatica ATCC 64428]|uniref:Glycoside hydrolase family 16 protein n=1 Tax=Fistulina hepatica ATCC 64428 TaxID=1128425 RepID=A0A0D7ADE8_9AGAR|nr:glycoside hydrolase family 16 protein [Fistulina hepatica ATCC 64428]